MTKAQSAFMELIKIISRHICKPTIEDSLVGKVESIVAPLDQDERASLVSMIHDVESFASISLSEAVLDGRVGQVAVWGLMLSAIGIVRCDVSIAIGSGTNAGDKEVVVAGANELLSKIRLQLMLKTAQEATKPGRGDD